MTCKLRTFVASSLLGLDFENDLKVAEAQTKVSELRRAVVSRTHPFSSLVRPHRRAFADSRWRLRELGSPLLAQLRLYSHRGTCRPRHVTSWHGRSERDRRLAIRQHCAFSTHRSQACRRRDVQAVRQWADWQCRARDSKRASLDAAVSLRLRRGAQVSWLQQC